MDIQLKRGLLEVCVLKALQRQDSYGYQIIKDISAHVKISESTLYPILKRMESSDFVTEYSVEHNGRLRKFYRITSGGVRQIDQFLEGWPEILRVYDFIKECAEHDARTVSQ